MPYGYSAGGGAWTRTDQSSTSAVLGDGGIYSSIDDLAKWDAALYDDRLLSAKSRELAFTPATHTDNPSVDYAFGWRVTGETLWHSGETRGFRNVITPLSGTEADRHRAHQSQRSRTLFHRARHRAAIPARRRRAVIQNDAVVLGLLAATLGVVLLDHAICTHPFWQRFYRYVPALVLCYFVPALYNSFGLIDGEQSKLYFIASRYLLPATLVLLTLAIDLPATLRLGPKALAMFFAATVQRGDRRSGGAPHLEDPRARQRRRRVVARHDRDRRKLDRRRRQPGRHERSVPDRTEHVSV